VFGFHDFSIATPIGGLVLIAFGFLYLRQPALYRRGIWMKTSLAIRLLSERNYILFMRGLGIAFIVLGIVLLVAAAVEKFLN
jgi:hypothetical protein